MKFVFWPGGICGFNEVEHVREEVCRILTDDCQVLRCGSIHASSGVFGAGEELKYFLPCNVSHIVLRGLVDHIMVVGFELCKDFLCIVEFAFPYFCPRFSDKFIDGLGLRDVFGLGDTIGIHNFFRRVHERRHSSTSEVLECGCKGFVASAFGLFGLSHLAPVLAQISLEQGIISVRCFFQYGCEPDFPVKLVVFNLDAQVFVEALGALGILDNTLRGRVVEPLESGRLVWCEVASLFHNYPGSPLPAFGRLVLEVFYLQRDDGWQELVLVERNIACPIGVYLGNLANTMS